MVNRVILIGNLGRDPEVRRLENGTLVAKLSMATNESYKDQSGEWVEKVEWHQVILWRSLAERAAKLRKGDTIYLEGKLTSRSWQDEQGINHKITEVVGNYYRKVGGPGHKDQAAGGFPSASDEPVSVPPAGEEIPAQPDDDLPF